MPLGFRNTPLGMGFGKTRFASPVDSFTLVYIAQDLATSIAEAIVRDRFEGLSRGWGTTPPPPMTGLNWVLA